MHVRKTGHSCTRNGIDVCYVEILCDTVAEIPDPAEHPEYATGSELRVLEDGGKKYILSCGRTWVEVPNFLKSEGGGDLDALTETVNENSARIEALENSDSGVSEADFNALATRVGLNESGVANAINSIGGYMAITERSSTLIDNGSVTLTTANASAGQYTDTFKLKGLKFLELCVEMDAVSQGGASFSIVSTANQNQTYMNGYVSSSERSKSFILDVEYLSQRDDDFQFRVAGGTNGTSTFTFSVYALTALYYDLGLKSITDMLNYILRK